MLEETMFGSIKETSCPKTDCPKKWVLLLIVDLFLFETNLLKEMERSISLLS
jgi:hypothetical protein